MIEHFSFGAKIDSIKKSSNNFSFIAINKENIDVNDQMQRSIVIQWSYIQRLHIHLVCVFVFFYLRHHSIEFLLWIFFHNTIHFRVNMSTIVDCSVFCLWRQIRSNFNHVNGFAVNSQPTFVVIFHCSLTAGTGMVEHFISLRFKADLIHGNHWAFYMRIEKLHRISSN